MDLGISTWVYMMKPIEEAVKRIHGSGIRFLEIWGDTSTHLDLMSPRGGRVPEILNVMNVLDMRAISLHAPFSSLDISSPDESKRRISVKTILKSIAFCREISCPQLVIHISSSPGVKTREELEVNREKAVKSLSEITELSSESGVEVLLENMALHPGHLRLGTEVEELLELVDLFKGKAVSVCIDTGHSVLNKHDPGEDIRRADRYLASLHINDNDGERDLHLPPGEGVIDWPEVYNALKDVGYNGVFILEIYGYDVVWRTIQRAKAYSNSLLEND